MLPSESSARMATHSWLSRAVGVSCTSGWTRCRLVVDSEYFFLIEDLFLHWPAREKYYLVVWPKKMCFFLQATRFLPLVEIQVWSQKSFWVVRDPDHNSLNAFLHVIRDLPSLDPSHSPKIVVALNDAIKKFLVVERCWWFQCALLGHEFLKSKTHLQCLKLLI